MLELPNPSFLADPNPTYRRLREEAPVSRIRVAGEPAWAVARYDDCVSVLRDPRLRVCSIDGSVSSGLADGPPSRVLHWLLAAQDPCDPNPVRAHVTRAFTPRAVDSLGPRVREVVEEVLDCAEDKDSFDLVEDFAYPVSVLAAAEFLGVPAEDYGLLYGWSPRAALPIEFAQPTPAEIADSRAATESLWAYFEDHVKFRRNRASDDLLSRLIGSFDAEGACADRELVALCVQLLAVGFRTTEALISGGAHALVCNPDAAAQLRRDSALVVSAIEECARWVSPVQMTCRQALDELCVGGFPIEEGEKIYTLIGSANRDAEIFEDPDVFDVARRGPPHLTFGFGSRPFLGGHTARMQAQIALRQLVRRFPELRVAAPATYRPSLLLRSLQHCPVSQAA